MKLQVYTLDVSALREDAELLARYKKAVSKQRLTKAETLRQAADQARTIGAGVLLAIAYNRFMELTEGSADAGSSSCVIGDCEVGDYEVEDCVVKDYVVGDCVVEDCIVRNRDMEDMSMTKLCKLARDLPEEKTGEKGKPYFPEGPYFNLSHAGDRVALVIADADVGIDIERIRPCKKGVMRRCFSAEEIARVERADTEGERNLYFTEIWTQKEALAKLTGEGIADILGQKKPEGAQLRTIRLDEEYVLSICYILDSWGC